MTVDFVVDTNSYAGNFERKLCVHLTGWCDQEKNFGFKEKSGVKDEIVSWIDDNIAMLPGGDGDAVWDSPYQLRITPLSAPRNYRGGQFNSVGIHFHERPPGFIIDFLKERAWEFAPTYTGDKLKILGFRLVTEETIEHSEDI